MSEEHKSSANDLEGLLRVLDLAGYAADWGFQMSGHFEGKPGGQHFWLKYRDYLLARTRYFASRRPLDHNDYGGCIGCVHTRNPDGNGWDWDIREDCAYHLAAKLQPWNHNIPWVCGNYWDGCNCEGGPFYDPPEGIFPLRSTNQD